VRANVDDGLKMADFRNLAPGTSGREKPSFSSTCIGQMKLRNLLQIQRSLLNGVKRTAKQWIDSSSEKFISC
jgi:hypothetical protein